MMKKLSFLLLLMLIFIFRTPLPALADEPEDGNILILNSYYRGFTWTDDEVDGILSSMSEQKWDYQISIEYMDWKRYPTQENLRNFYNMMKMKYASKDIDVIVCTDDAAFQFALTYRKELFSNAPVVFSGINTEGLVQIAKGQDNYTGVMEEINPEGTIRAALAINPKIRNIYLVYDNTESGLSTGKLCRDAATKIDKNLNVVALNDYKSDSILNFVSDVDKNSMVLVTTFFTDTDGSNIDHELFCEKLSMVSNVPIYHLYDFAMGSDILGGNLIIGGLQGEEAGKLAVRILNGEKASSIKPIEMYTNQLTFDYPMLKHFGISESSLPSGSKVVNAPFSFFETYKKLVITVSLIFAFMVSFTVLLLFYIKRIKIMQKKLEENNEELSQLYEKLAASEEELQLQYSKVTEANEKLEEYSATLYYRSHHDALTGLYNRLYLSEEIEKHLYKGAEEGALYFIDLDNFKYVNDSLGHNAGDELLKAISSRLMSVSTKNDILVRLGGDEFVYYTNEIKNKDAAEQFALKILDLFTIPFPISNNMLSVTASIGVVMFPEDGQDLDILLRNADMAMYKVKEKGKKGYRFFHNLFKEEFLERIHIENYFKKALDEQEFQLFYQPQINVNADSIDGFEALIRWDSPELGYLPPLKFIPIAEENGFIITLGEWILRTSCIYIKMLNDRIQANYKISVNISVIQLLQDDFANIVKNILEKTGLDASLLELEITESVIMESAKVITKKIAELREIGVRIALDDFGTGYSSLSYVKSLPITTLKIDKIFVDDIKNSDSNTNVTDTIIDLGHKMELTIIAEGVETEAQLAYLIENGCDVIQGYLYSKPLPEKELEKWICNF